MFFVISDRGRECFQSEHLAEAKKYADDYKADAAKRRAAGVTHSHTIPTNFHVEERRTVYTTSTLEEAMAGVSQSFGMEHARIAALDESQLSTLTHDLSVAAGVYDSNVALLKLDRTVPGNQFMIDQFEQQAVKTRKLLETIEERGMAGA